MNNEKLLVSSEQAFKAIFDIKNYCNQQNECAECSLYQWCLSIYDIPLFWELEKIKK